MTPSIAKGALALLMLGAATARAEPPALAAAPAQLREIPKELRLDGVVEAIHQTTVSAQTSGQVQKVLFDVDDFVEKDAVLLILKDTEQQSRVTQAAADLKEAVARLEEARDEHARTKEIFAKKLIAESAMDRAEAALKSANARVEAAQAHLSQSKTQLGYTQVRAPYSGLVTRRQIQVGETAQPGQALLTGISLEQLRVVVDVPQSQVMKVRDKGKARIQLPGGGWVEGAKLTVFPIADQASNTFKVRVELPEGTKGLFPGMYVKTSFATGSKQDLVVPEQAVVYRSEVTAAYVLDDKGELSFRHLRVGRRLDDGGLLVLAGLAPGERVALDPIAAGVELKRRRAGARP